MSFGHWQAKPVKSKRQAKLGIPLAGIVGQAPALVPRSSFGRSEAHLSSSVFICLYLSLSVFIYLHLSLSIFICLYLSLSVFICLYLSLSVFICLLLSSSVFFWVILSYSGFFWNHLSSSVFFWLKRRWAPHEPSAPCRANLGIMPSLKGY